ncbi:MAG: hypothetical protein HONBIEJF_01966 [Fimbriimonadaceae bacterium]|nr:hypothetical protein [Fimbriimonadaceae bacterium]
MESPERIAAMFKALGDPTRLRIFAYLLSLHDETERAIRSESGATVGEICCFITGAPRVSSKVSFHLKELRMAGLITMSRRGKNVICKIVPEACEEVNRVTRSIVRDAREAPTQAVVQVPAREQAAKK